MDPKIIDRDVPAVSETVEAPAPEETTEAVVTASEEPEAEAPAYTPNRKFKFTDEEGEKEAEFDEWVNPYLSKDSEDKFRDLYSKAKALEFVKARRDKVAQEKASIENDYNQTRATLTDVLGLREKDLGLFLEKVGVKEQQVAKWLLEKAEAQEKLKDLPEPLRNMYNEVTELRRKNLEFEKQLNGAQSSGVDASSQVLSLQVQGILSKPEIAALANDYDSRRGEPNAFFEVVKREGLLEHATSGRTLSAEEAVGRALKTLALSVQAPSQGATPNGTVAAPKVVMPKTSAVIPNVGGGSAPTSSKKPRSIDDLRKLAKEMSASNR